MSFYPAKKQANAVNCPEDGEYRNWHSKNTKEQFPDWFVDKEPVHVDLPNVKAQPRRFLASDAALC